MSPPARDDSIDLFVTMTCTLTLPYKQLRDSDHHIHLDLYPPRVVRAPTVPAVVYFHGGGLTVGNRTSWSPEWLLSRSNVSSHPLRSLMFTLSRKSC